MQRKDLEKIRDNFIEKLAHARNSKERNKYIGELLEVVVKEIFKEKGYAVYPHEVETRGKPDVLALDNGSGFVMEIGNLKQFMRSGKPEYYAKEKIRRHIKHMKKYAFRYGINDYYVLVSFDSILNVGKEMLKRANVKILEIGSQVTPENLIEVYPKLRTLLDNHFPDVKIEEEEWLKKARSTVYLIKEDGTLSEVNEE